MKKKVEPTEEDLKNWINKVQDDCINSVTQDQMKALQLYADYYFDGNISKVSLSRANFLLRIAEALAAERQKARNEALEDAINSIEGDILVTPDEFTPKEKIRVFDMLKRLANHIRALKSEKQK